ncbi:MAG: hypothetical protein GY713_11670 [Actinomycetia bacterium]|nr:hypothetical protein [Actinomycetes bacterium]
MSDKSRYVDAERRLVPGPHGREVVVVDAPHRDQPPLQGRHVRRDGERLDHLASYYLRDASGFWRICDAADVMTPDVLTDAESVPIPRGGAT